MLVRGEKTKIITLERLLFMAFQRNTITSLSPLQRKKIRCTLFFFLNQSIMFICFRNLGAINVLLFMFNLFSTSPYCTYWRFPFALMIWKLYISWLQKQVEQGKLDENPEESGEEMKWQGQRAARREGVCRSFSCHKSFVNMGFGNVKKAPELILFSEFDLFSVVGVIQKKELQMMEPVVNHADAGT